VKIIKYISLIVLVTIIGILGYIYYLTFTQYGRLNWGQAVFLKLAATDDVAERLK
jgi:acetyl esterase